MALWGAAVFAIGLFVIGWRWAFTLVLALLMLGIGGWDTVRESFTDMRVRSYFGVYTVTDDSYRHQRRLAHGTTLHGLQRTDAGHRSEEHTSELQSLMRISYAVFCLKKKK